MLHNQKWPEWDESKTVEDQVEIAIQINGKVRDRITIPSGLDRQETENAAMKDPKVTALIEGKNIVKVIAVPGKLVNIVVK